MRELTPNMRKVHLQLKQLLPFRQPSLRLGFGDRVGSNFSADLFQFLGVTASNRHPGTFCREQGFQAFKRYRCARKLQLRSVPYASLGEDEGAAIMNLLRISNNRALSILEQAAFIDELNATGCLSVAEMAKELSRSKSWVSMRLGLISEMSPTIRAKLFSGAFPVYSYMYLPDVFGGTIAHALVVIAHFQQCPLPDRLRDAHPAQNGTLPAQSAAVHGSRSGRECRPAAR
jgi:hypothetical protein